jgi:hypothetical protein
VQHSLAAEQSAPSLLQVWTAAPQKPLGHEPVQHSDAETHAAPFDLHCAAPDPELPPLQPAPTRATRQIARPANQ